VDHRARLAAAEAGQALHLHFERLPVDPEQHRGDLVGGDPIDVADEAQGDVIIFGVDPAGAGKAASQAGKRVADLGRDFQSGKQTRHRWDSRCLGLTLRIIAQTPKQIPVTNHRRLFCT